MGLLKEASKVLTNKYFLYLMVFLAVSNVLGYLVTNKLNAVILFALVSLLTYQFSKNMAVVLLVGLLVTNLMITSRMIKEGLENKSDDSETTQKAMDRDQDIKNAATALKKTGDVQKAKEMLEKKKESEEDDSEPEKVNDPNNHDLNNKGTATGPEGVGEKLSKAKNSKSEHFGPRLDYAATLDQSYQQLDELLGSDSIKQLTGDTQKLMQQQQNLFNTMNQMVPVLEGAQNMLKGFDIKGLTNSLSQVSNMGKK
jgi:hypothetical protein